MDERIGGLNQVAKQGNIDDFYNLIKNDVKLLEHIDELPFVDTPLHILASAGHIPFSIEMMKLKPSFISKPNPDGHKDGVPASTTQCGPCSCQRKGVYDSFALRSNNK